MANKNQVQHKPQTKGRGIVIIQCAWCKKELKKNDIEPKDKISHGICLTCKEKLLAEEFEDKNKK